MTETATPTAEEVRTRREKSRSWYGYLADDTVEHVAQRISNLLTGRRYTWVSYNVEQVRFAHPTVRTGQRLTPEHATDGKALRVHHLGDPRGYDEGVSTSAGISAADTYGAWGIHASHATEAAARADAEDEVKRTRTTYVHIEGGCSDDPRDVGRNDHIEVRHYNYVNPPEMLVWVIAIEPSADEEE